MAKQYLIDELPEEFRGAEYSQGIPVGIYFNPAPASGNLIIQMAENAIPTVWPLGAATPEEVPETFTVEAAYTPGNPKLGDRAIDTRPIPPSGYPIDDIVKIIEAART